MSCAPDEEGVPRKVHGVLMIFGWWAFITPGFFLARYFRRSFTNKACWFEAHRAINVNGVLLVIAGFLSILITFCFGWNGGFEGVGGYHAIVGLVASICAFLQPVMSLLRCKPGTKYRPIYNWIHRLTGVGGIILASTAICLAVEIEWNFLRPTDAYGWAPKGFVIGYLIAIGIIFIGLELHVYWTETRQKRVLPISDSKLEKPVGSKIRMALLMSSFIAGIAVCTALTIFIVTFTPPVQND